jgi:hypothetical protein
VPVLAAEDSEDRPAKKLKVTSGFGDFSGW